ncbi:ATP-binding protein [Aestuariirhabdus litorea]|nr:ATP-binding protein [Aestuariirhabdus litorea]
MNNETKYMQKIFPIELVLDAMKDNGYKDAAHAVAELIDNSIQSGLEIKKKTHVQLICKEQSSLISDRNSSRIEQIAVYDNAGGMDKDELQSALAFGMGSRRKAKDGIGKFGMGLPNASISQCNRVDVYSWKNGKTYHTYLDIKEIAREHYDVVPEPQLASLPNEWVDCIQGEIEGSGTLVIWSDLDRLKWKRHKAFFSNVEFIVGRMYRYFIGSNCEIRMAAYNGCIVYDQLVKANDPLYLTKDTNTPAPFDSSPGFVSFYNGSIPVAWNGKIHNVNLKVSMCDHKFRKDFNSYYSDKSYGNPGATPFGKHCAKNLGISIVRAGRELELNNSFTNVYDPTERFWGAEISFSPELDEVFGVTNNKQAATALRQLSLADIAQEEGLDSKSEADAFMNENNDIRLPVIRVSEKVVSILSAVRGELDKQRKGSVKKNDYSSDLSHKAEGVATKFDQKLDAKGESDRKSDTLSDEQKAEEIKEELERDGLSLSEEDTKKLISDALQSSDKFIITSADIRGADIIFDVTTPGGKLKVTINESHPFYKNLVSDIADDPQYYDIIKLLFSAWAIMEDKQQDEQYKEWLLEARKDWGYYAKQMLTEYLKNG